MAVGIRRIILFLTAILMLVILGRLVPAQANHSLTGGPNVICLDGAIFTGTSTAASSLNLSMQSQVYDSLGNVKSLGNAYTFTSLNESFTFTVKYDIGTFNPGDIIYLSLTDVPGTFNGIEGWIDVYTVSDCLLPRTGVACQIDDGRINSNDCAAPIAIYDTANGFNIWAIDSVSGKGSWSLTLLDQDIPDPGTSNQELIAAVHMFNGQMIRVYLLTTGELQVNVNDAEGKLYARAWSRSNPRGTIYDPGQQSAHCDPQICGTQVAQTAGFLSQTAGVLSFIWGIGLCLVVAWRRSSLPVTKP